MSARPATPDAGHNLDGRPRSERPLHLPAPRRPHRRRRWPVRASRRDGTEAVVDVQTPESRDGLVLLRIDDAVIELRPEEVSRVRHALLQAQAVALQDRDRW